MPLPRLSLWLQQRKRIFTAVSYNVPSNYLTRRDNVSTWEPATQAPSHFREG
jgi:hypothetical protein